MQLLKQYELLGEDKNLEMIDEILKNNSNFICNIYGEKGTGKTQLLNSINEITKSNKRKIIHNSFQEFEFDNNLTIIIDDVDEKLTHSEFKDIILNLFTNYEDIQIFFTSKGKFFSNKITCIDNFIIALGHRNLKYDQFEIWFDYVIAKQYNDDFLSKITEVIKKNIFLFCKYIKNYNNINEIINSLEFVVNEQDVNKSFANLVLTNDFLTQLQKDLFIEQRLDDSETLLNIRGKNTVEKLKDLIIKYYPDKNFLYKVLKSTYNNSIFIEEIFNSKITYEDIIIQLCFYYSPIELICNLLGPRDVIKELDERALQSVDYSMNNDEKIKIILRDVGLNILEKPKGISYYFNALKENYSVIDENMNTSMRKEHLIGIGVACYQEMENILFEFVNFYSTYFCGSFSSFMDMYIGNDRGTIIEKISFDKYVNIVKFLNRVALSEEYQISMLSLQKKELVTAQVIDNLEKLSTFKKAISHKHSHKSSFYALKRLILQIYEVAQSVMEDFQNLNVFPEIIKIKKSILDEFGRKLIIANDCDETEIRFSLSEDVDDLDINYHYYLLRKTKNITINPLIIQRTINDNHKIFKNNSSLQKTMPTYKSKTTQTYNNTTSKQTFSNTPVESFSNVSNQSYSTNASTQNMNYDDTTHNKNMMNNSEIQYFDEIDIKDEFLKDVSIANNSKVLIIGCGDGTIARDLFKTNKSIKIDAFDSSKDMINKAFKTLNEANIEQSEVRLFTMNELNMDMDEEYNFIYSKSALHWINSSEIMYKKIYKALKFNGKIAIHQGGFGSYRGLHKMVLKSMKELDILNYYEGWKYPVYYPTKDELENYLSILGFSNVNVKSIETDGAEYDTIVENFSKVDMMPYLNVLQNDILKSKLKEKYFELCSKHKVDTYTHRLFITGEKR